MYWTSPYACVVRDNIKDQTIRFYSDLKALFWATFAYLAIFVTPLWRLNGRNLRNTAQNLMWKHTKTQVFDLICVADFILRRALWEDSWRNQSQKTFPWLWRNPPYSRCFYKHYEKIKLILNFTNTVELLVIILWNDFWSMLWCWCYAWACLFRARL